MRRILSIITTLLLFASISQAQIIERYVKAIETVETDSSFVYRGEDIPVLDISYHEWSADSITWRKNYVSGDCFIRFSNDIKSTWAAYNVCTGMGSGTSQIDTILWTVNGITDTITEGTANLYLTSPDTISGSSTNFQDSLTHTHELYIVLDDNKDVETTGVSDGQVIKWNSITEEWEASNDLIGGGAAGYLTVGEQGGGVSVANVREILVENGRLTDNGAGSVSIDFLLDPVNGAQDFFRTDTLTIYEAVTDTFIEFSTVFPDNDYTLSNAYAIYNDNSRQNLVYDSIAADGFRVLSILDTAVVHYLAMRNLDSLGLAVAEQGKVLASGGDTELGYLNSKTDDSTITVVNNQLHVTGFVSEEDLTDGSIDADFNTVTTDSLSTAKIYYSDTYWDDMRVPVLSTKGGGTKEPDWGKAFDNGAGSQGVFTYWFDPSTEEEVYFTAQLPHSYKHGTDIKAHVHWIAESTAGAAGTDVCWGLEYTWANIADSYGNTTLIYGDEQIGGSGETITEGKHYMTELGAISGTGKRGSSMLVCRIFRDATGTGGTDDYTDDGGLLEIDFHFEIDKPGSDEEAPANN